VHVSGHCDAADLREVVERADPAVLFPVHTEHPELFRGLVGDAVEDIRIPERGREYSV
jgi:mRNA degradation ribonuclease J1/J2